MTHRTMVELVDDVDGGRADQTVFFSLDGVPYETDLSQDHAAKLRIDFARWAMHARRVGGSHRMGTYPDSTVSEEEAAKRWLDRHQSLDVADRESIMDSMREAFTGVH